VGFPAWTFWRRSQDAAFSWTTSVDGASTSPEALFASPSRASPSASLPEFLWRRSRGRLILDRLPQTSPQRLPAGLFGLLMEGRRPPLRRNFRASGGAIRGRQPEIRGSRLSIPRRDQDFGFSAAASPDQGSRSGDGMTMFPDVAAAFRGPTAPERSGMNRGPWKILALFSSAASPRCLPYPRVVRFQKKEKRS
jgi:hypothetical protein